MSNRILILGATSAIGHAAARIWAERGARLYLVARHPDRLAANAADLRTRGAAEVTTATADLADTSGHPGLIASAWEAWQGFDRILIAHGSLGDQAAGEGDFTRVAEELAVNFLSPVSLCTELANRLQAAGEGVLGVIGSVAGERGRQSNYLYGCAKGGLAVYLQGLRNRLFKHGVKVVTILPGFVDTPMTASMPKNALYASPDKVGLGIVRAMDRGQPVVYLPWFWRYIMLIIRLIPERLFRKLSL